MIKPKPKVLTYTLNWWCVPCGIPVDFLHGVAFDFIAGTVICPSCGGICRERTEKDQKGNP